MGRIGRHVFRLLDQSDKHKCVLLNDINPDIENIAYTINYDSIYKINIENFRIDRDCIISDSNSTKATSFENILDIDFYKYKIDILIDATGLFENVAKAKELLKNGFINKAIFTFNTGEEDLTLIFGANENEYNKKSHNIISAGICDANAIAPVLKLISDNFGIENGYITTLHPWLNYQNLLDGRSSSWSFPEKTYHHYALGRSSFNNIIPKPTSALDVTFSVLKSLDDSKIKCFSYRSPHNIVCSADLTINIKNKAKLKDIKSVFQTFIKNQNLNILKINFSPLVSTDFIQSNFSAIIDDRWTDIIDDNLLKLVLWYDNEFGYASRVVDLVNYLGDT